MTTPTILPTGYDGTYKDWLKTKVDRDGCVRLQYSTVTIPAATASSTVIGLVPFNKGARLSYGSKYYTADLDTSTNVTLNVGYVYQTGSSATDDPDAFASAVTTGQTGGLITFDEQAGLSFVAEDNGWIAVQIGGGATTTEGAVSGQSLMVYDGLSASN